MTFNEVKNQINVPAVTFRPFVAEDKTVTDWYRDWKEPVNDGKPKSIVCHKDTFDKMLAAKKAGTLDSMDNFGWKVEEKAGKKHAKYDNYVIFLYDGETF